MELKIYLKDVMRTMQLASGSQKVFAISYQKKDGSYGEKEECRNRSGNYNPVAKSDLSSIKHENKTAGKAILEYKTRSGAWQKFEIFWCLLRTFEGRTIDHRF